MRQLILALTVTEPRAVITIDMKTQKLKILVMEVGLPCMLPTERLSSY